MKRLILLFLIFTRVSFAQSSCTELFSNSYRPSYAEFKRLGLVSISQNNQSRLEYRQNAKLKLSNTNPTYKGLQLKKIENLGQVNAGIFEFEDPVSGPSILKLYKFSEDKFYEFGLVAREAYELSIESSEILSYLRGNLISQEFNGPKLYDSGFIKDSDNNFYFYLHLERVFPGEKFWSIKENSWKIKENKIIGKILKNHPEVIDKIKAEFEVLAQRYIVPYDPDIVITKDGRIRWIDTDNWEIGTPEQTYLNQEFIIGSLDRIKKRTIFWIY